MSTAPILTQGGYRTSRVTGGPFDGALVVHDVPIFCDCERGDLTFSRDWILSAVQRAKRKESEDDFLPPLHVRHHEPETAMTNAVQYAGVFRITGVQPLHLDGAARLGVFADLIVTEGWAQSDIRRMRYPYRSVEIFDPLGDEPAIDGLALLDHEAPFLAMPMLKIQGGGPGAHATSGLTENVPSGTFRDRWTMDAGGDGELVIACFRKGSTTHVLFRAESTESSDMTKTKDKPDAKDGARFADDEHKDPETAKAGKGDGDDEQSNMEGESFDLKALLAAIKDGKISVADLKELQAAIAEQETGAADTEDVDTAPAPAATPGAGEAMKKTGEDAVTFAKLQGRIDALEAKDAAREKADNRKTAVSAALKRLGDRPLPENFQAQLETVFDKCGAEGFKAYVDTFAATFAAIGETIDDEDVKQAFTGQRSGAALSSAASKYATLGATAADKAAHFSAEWKQLHESRAVRMSEERYLELNMQKLGHELPASQTA